MTQNYQRSLDTKYYTGLSHHFFSHSASEELSSLQPWSTYDQRAGRDFVGRNSIRAGEIGHRMSFWSPRPKFLQQYVTRCGKIDHSQFLWKSRFGYGSTQILLLSSTVKEPGSKKFPKPSYGQKPVHGSPVPQFTIFRETECFVRT